MNKIELAQWIIKRIGGKVEDLRDVGSEDMAHMIADDAETYLGVLHDIVKEIILP